MKTKESTDTCASIFNDVLGPVMRGPSSSHSAASLRIGRIARDLLGAIPERVEVDYDPNGSLVTTHTGQGTDMGLAGGIFGWEADDERLPDYLHHGEELGIEFKVNYLAYGASHPNTYRLRVFGAQEKLSLTAISTGGGMMEVIECEGIPVSFGGNFFESLIFGSMDQGELITLLGDYPAKLQKLDGLLVVSTLKPLPENLLAAISQLEGVDKLRKCNPVLTVLGESFADLPFRNASELAQYAELTKASSLADLAIEFESARGVGSKEMVLKHIEHRLQVMKKGVQRGLAGTEYADRILPSQVGKFREKMDQGSLVQGDVLNEVILHVTALMENKSSMGALVAAPTAGSCGACPGAILGVATAMQFSDEDTARALLAAGLIGVFVANGATFAAEEAGCMAECGAGSSMAAAGLVTLLGGSVEQALGAASMALQNCLGMICDPIADRVEAPCLGKNVLAASNAISSANMALSGFQHLIPLDEVIESMARVGHQMPSELCCTGKGGLAITPTGQAIHAELNKGEYQQQGRPAACFKCGC